MVEKLEDNGNFIKGMLFLILYALTAVLSNTFIKMVGGCSSFQKAFIRNIGIFFFCFVLLIIRKQSFHVAKELRLTLILRSVVGTVAVWLIYYGISHINLADATMFTNLSPLFTVIVSAFFLKEKINKKILVCFFFALIACILVIKPSGNISNFLGGLACLLAAVLTGSAYTFLTILSRKKMDKILISFYMSLIAMVITIPFLIGNFAKLSIKDNITLLGGGLFACLAQIIIAYAYMQCSSNKIAIFGYSELLFSAIIGYLLFSELPDIYSWIGYSILIATALFQYFTERKKSIKYPQIKKPFNNPAITK